MKITGPGKLLRIFISESDHWNHEPLYTAIVRRAHDEGLAGATVIRGIESFGAHSRIHTMRILRLSEELPVIIEIVDGEERINAFLPILDEMVDEGLVTIENVEILKYRHRFEEGQEEG
ncbi:MAG: DUF190 domain-containing protein [Actinomycetota bacterium]|nr:DUF190 domain-containing protein [Actinomycetota bacterium]